MIKHQKFHHSVTENGNLQLRIITEYQDDEGKVLDKKYSNPVTPADTKDMTGWDDRSKEIVEAITDPDVERDFNLEYKSNHYVAPDIDGNTGIQMTTDYDRTLDDLGRISVRRITRIFDEGEEVSKKYHRSWIMPGDDTSKADVISRAVADKLHTQDVINAYKAKMAEQELEMELNIKEK